MSAYLNTGTNPARCTRAQNTKGQLKIRVPDLEGILMAQTQQESLENCLSHPFQYVSAVLGRDNREITQGKWLMPCINPLNYSPLHNGLPALQDLYGCSNALPVLLLSVCQC